jgi:hypothetical protein
MIDGGWNLKPLDCCYALYSCCNVASISIEIGPGFERVEQFRAFLFAVHFER